jgi:hypothetical protein
VATYKLIQDIEAEDHILGPLTLRQFIFALIAIFCFYLSFIVTTKHAAFLLVLFLPPGLFFGFFAVPFGRDQPTEIWALAKIRYFLKPRKRIWDQSGVKELVTITVPKKIERHLTNGLNQYEVESRLTTLANTLDSRGWAIKNSSGVATSAFAVAVPEINSDRLVDLGNETAQVPEDQVPAGADMLDETTNPVAQHFTQMIDESSATHRQQLIQQMNSPTPPAPSSPSSSPSPSGSNQWFMPHADNTPSDNNITAPDVTSQQETPDEMALAEHIKAEHSAQQLYNGNLRTLQPLGSLPPVPPQTDVSQPVQATDQGLTDQHDPAIMSLANNDDFNVDTIAREAKRAQQDRLDDQDEVVISLR